MSICAGWDNGRWGVCGNLLGCCPEPRSATNNVPKQKTDDPIYSAKRVLPGPSVRLQATKTLKSQIRVYCFCMHTKCQHINETWFQSSSTDFTLYYCCSQSSLKTHTALPQSSFWKAALRLNKAKDQPALRGHSKERDLWWIGPDSDLTATAAERSAS